MSAIEYSAAQLEIGVERAKHIHGIILPAKPSDFVSLLLVVVGIDTYELLQRGQCKRHICQARQAIRWALRKYYSLSLAHIAELTGARDPSSAAEAFRNVERADGQLGVLRDHIIALIPQQGATE